jgi:hypothetical protein
MKEYMLDEMSVRGARSIPYVLFTRKGNNFSMCVSPVRFHCRKGAVSEVPNFQRLLGAFMDKSCKLHIIQEG